MTVKNVLVLLMFGSGLLSIGCGPKTPNPTYKPELETSYGREPEDPDIALADQLRQGAVQMSLASDTVQSALIEARSVAKSLSGELKLAAQDVIDLLDDAGESVAEGSADPPSEADIKKDFAASDDERKKRIEFGNDAFRSLETALGTLEGLESQLIGLATLKDTVTLAMEDLADAIEAYGGKVESELEAEQDPSEGK